MMFSYRLVRLIETHAETLADGLERKVMASSSLKAFRALPSHELRERVYEIYRHLGDWLLGESQTHIEQRYREIGARRAWQKVPLAEVVLVIVFTKENLWDFLESDAVVDRAVEIMGELELLQMLDRFFDHAIYFTAAGYQEQLDRIKQEEQEAAACRAETT
jgi:hypothetical protein